MTLEHLADICVGNPGALQWLWAAFSCLVGGGIVGWTSWKRGYRQAEKDRDNELHVDALDQPIGDSHG